MKINRLIWKSWSCMFLAVRILTLVAFTAHAVLGCCLSHGSCMRDQVAVLSGYCCEHDEHAHEELLHSDAEHELNSVSVSVAVCLECPREGHGHSNHCDDGKCVFGVSGSNGNSGDWQPAVVLSWINASVDHCRGPSQLIAFLGNWLDGPPRIHKDRSVLQVWRI